MLSVLDSGKSKINEETWDFSNAPEFPKKIKKNGAKKITKKIKLEAK